jgi:tRNA-guanine family transglycosylase
LGKLVFFCAGARRGNLPAGGAKNILVNVPANGRNGNAVIKTREMMTHFKSRISMLDSGGFTILKGEEKGKQVSFDPARPLTVSSTNVNLAPRHVIDAAVALQPGIMVALDYPIKKIKDPKDQEGEFRKKLPYNISWAIETARLKKKYCPDVELFIPIQCYTVKNFSEFIKGIKGISFDGFSMPVRNLRLQDIAQFLFEFYNTGVKKVHLLGTSSFMVAALAAYFSNHHFQWASLDSVSWRIAGEHGIYLTPQNLGYISLKGTNLGDKEGIKEKCRCRACRKASFADLMAYPYKDRCLNLWAHNLHAIETACHDLHEHSTDLVSLERFLKARTVKEKKIDELIRCLEPNGPDSRRKGLRR